MAESLRERLGDPSKTLYLVDISSFIFRAFFAIRSLSNRKGEPTNAVYGVATMLARLADEAKPEYLAVVYDSKEPSFRKEIFPEYKANRSAPPDDLIPQFDRIEELIRCFEIFSFRQPGVEADDLIATLTRKWIAAAPANRVVVVTSDKDLMQLVGERVRIWDTMSNRIYGAPEVEEKFGVRPEQIRDYLALVGDSSDNIPGVPSIGPKTAADLLREHGTLEAVLQAAAAGRIPGKKAEALREHEEDARMSAELATVHDALTMELDPAACRYRFQVTDSCARLLAELDFHTLLKRWAPDAALAAGAPAERLRPEAASGSAASDSALDGPEGPDATEAQLSFAESSSAAAKPARTARPEPLDRAGRFGFDLETTSLNPRQAELVGIAVCHDPSFASYLPVGHRDESKPQLPAGLVLERLKPLLESPKHGKIGQNLKYDWSVLGCLGLRARGIEADTMVAAYVLDAEGRHNLETLALNYLDYAVTTYEQVCGKGKDQLAFDQVPIDQAARYSAEDALVAVRLWERLRPKLESEDLMDIYRRVDLPLVEILSKMERHGVCVDVPWLQSLAREFERDLRGIEERIQAYTQGPVNLNSPKQLGHLLFEQLKLPSQGRTKTGFSTDAKVLEALAPLHEVPRLLLEYREISKLKGTYVDPLPGLRDPKTGRIHASFHQTVAATGRLSSSDPNLQNIPIRSERGRKIRRAFVPGEGNVLLSADYSQIELRILAHMSEDPELVGSFRRDEDVHARTASEIFSVPPESVDDRQRGIAKAINFGLMYGKTAFGLAQELKIPKREAQDVIDRYFQRYRGVKRFLDGLIVDAKEKGYFCTALGRKRRLPDIRSANPAMRANAERMAMNTPIQGTAADLMKLAMIELDRRLESGGYRSKLAIQVHDEVVLDCPKDEVDEVQKLVCEVMQSAEKLDVPLKVNSGTGGNWMDL
jgi:DNA polymerase I